MDTSVGILDRASPVYIAGHRGLVGSALLRRFQAEGFTNLLVRSRSELDLTDRAATFDYRSGVKASGHHRRCGQGRRHHGQQHLSR